MNESFIFYRYSSPRNRKLLWLQLLWVLGLLIGISCALSFSKTATYILESALQMQPSFIRLFFVIVLPIAVASVAIYFKFFTLCYPLMFLVALGRGFNGMLLFILLGSGAWLVRFLFLFSTSCGSMLLWWFLIRHCRGNLSGLTKDFCVAVILDLFFVFIDIHFFSPFLTHLFKYI